MLNCEIKELSRKLSQARSKTSEYVFNSRNTETSVDWMIDLHGLTKVEALRVVSARLTMTRDGLRSDSINPNSGNGRDHIFKIITGAGKHSIKFAVLKPAVNSWLKENNYEHYSDLQHGVFLVRLNK